MENLMLIIQHRLNPLHVYCRLVDKGLNKKVSMSVCKYYEILIYDWLHWLSIVGLYLCKLPKSWTS